MLLGMQISPTIMENSVEFPQNIKNRAAIWSGNPTPGCISKAEKPSMSEKYLHSRVNAALVTLANLSQQPRALQVDASVKERDLIRHKKE